jgi:polyhydroxybutyrate depolymerase
MEAIPNVLSYWVNFNNCNATPVVTDVPNINLTDGCSAVHYLYSGGTNGVEVEHYKIIDGGHTWPGSIFTIGVTNNDFNASKKIWQFFLQYDINGRLQANSVQDETEESITIFPNPTKDNMLIQGLSQTLTSANCRVFSVEGKQCDIHFSGTNSIDISHLEDGVYFLRIETPKGVSAIQFVKI